MKLKKGVTLVGLHLCMRKALVLADRLIRKYGGELVITATTNGGHSVGSYHYYGFAIDFRKLVPGTEPRETILPAGNIEAFVSELRQQLGPQYNVLDEGDHFHINATNAYSLMGMPHWSSL